MREECDKRLKLRHININKIFFRPTDRKKIIIYDKRVLKKKTTSVNNS